MATDAQDLKRPAPVVFTAKASRSAPVTTVGVIGWLRENLFYSIPSTLLTFAGLYLVYWFAGHAWEWGVTNAVWQAQSRRECLDTNPDGACWAGVIAWFNGYIYGRYPDTEQWRVNSAFIVLLLWLAPMWLRSVERKIGFGVTAVLLFPFFAGHLFLGGERGAFMTVMVFAALAVFVYNWLHVLSSLLTGLPLRNHIVALTGFGDRHEGTHKYPLLATIAIIAVLLYAALGSTVLLEVKTNLWGGLFLTLVIAGIGITSALPLGILLALARRSDIPIIRVFAIAFIELFRSVPLITVLFMAVTMMPLFLPEGFQLNKLVQAIIGVCLFSAAYMAEIVRGGLQAIPSGHYEAAKSLGLNYWQSMNLIVLPQALKLMIPNIVGNFMGLFKDTTLVSIIGLYDMLLMIKASGVNPRWNGLHTEPLIFGVAIFFIFCFAMSRYSQHLERKLGAGDSR